MLTSEETADALTTAVVFREGLTEALVDVTRVCIAKAMFRKYSTVKVITKCTYFKSFFLMVSESTTSPTETYVCMNVA
jgi:hypothetical protein